MSKVRRFRPNLVRLSERIVPAWTFDWSGGVMTITSDDEGDLIFVTRQGNALLYNGQLLGKDGEGTSAVDNTNQIIFHGNGGNDRFYIENDVPTNSTLS